MGEAARLWLFLMPWFLWIGGSFWASLENRECADHRSPGTRIWIVGLGMQLLVCLLTVTRVNGFRFGV